MAPGGQGEGETSQGAKSFEVCSLCEHPAAEFFSVRAIPLLSGMFTSEQTDTHAS